ncbi:MAG: hypothetical protein AB7H90_07095, partial [Alphaproteobacteria bacterium]
MSSVAPALRRAQCTTCVDDSTVHAKLPVRASSRGEPDDPSASRAARLVADCETGMTPEEYLERVR